MSVDVKCYPWPLDCCVVATCVIPVWRNFKSGTDNDHHELHVDDAVGRGEKFLRVFIRYIG